MLLAGNNACYWRVRNRPDARYTHRSLSMSHYTANLRGLEFNLFEFLDTKDRFGTGPSANMDEDTARGVLSEIRRLAEGPLAESFADADRTPPVFDPATSSVTLPESFKKSFRIMAEGEWHRLDLPEEL